MWNLYGFICVQRSLSVFMDLRQQSTYLHVCLALVLHHFKAKWWLSGVIEIVLNVIASEALEASFKAQSALIKDSKLLIAERHIVMGEQKNELIAWVVLSLYLFKHGLSLLKQDESLLKTFLWNEVDGTFIEFKNHNWDLIYQNSIKISNNLPSSRSRSLL